MKRAHYIARHVFTISTRIGMLLALVLVLLTGCDSSPMEEPVPSAESPTAEPAPQPPTPTETPAPAPRIEMSSISVALTDGGQGLQFFAQADQDVFYRKVTIQPPPPFREVTYNLGNSFVITEETIRLQGANSAYRKVGGSWSFVFEVTTGTGANARDHTVTVNYSIAGKNTVDADVDAGLTGTVAR